MAQEAEIIILVQSGGFAAIGGLMLGLWQDIKGKQLPAFETTESPATDKKAVQKKQNVRARAAFVFTCSVLSAVLGLMIALYYLGFMATESIPNAYGRAFISIGAGFLMPKILEHTESLSISKLTSRYFGKGT
ncbi:MAG: hypothetical protein JXQ95_19195 [Alteromonas stellipolaris]|uniref:hypothetical protein n=1 Tax=Alteromonas stellipolaris TaxID=233316 RepID=UPI003B8AB157